MDVNTLAIFYWYNRRRRRNKHRSCWVHPIVSDRFRFGTFQTLMNQLRMDESKFFNYFRMSCNTFNDLLRRVEGDLIRQNTVMRSSISPEERLAICIRLV